MLFGNLWHLMELIIHHERNGSIMEHKKIGVQFDPNLRFKAQVPIVVENESMSLTL